jgi:hypothetical protein
MTPFQREVLTVIVGGTILFGGMALFTVLAIVVLS